MPTVVAEDLQDAPFGGVEAGGQQNCQPVCELGTADAATVGEIDQNRVVRKARLVKLVLELPEILGKVHDHALEGHVRSLLAVALVLISVALSSREGTIRHIRRDVGEESPVAFGLEELPSIPKSNVGEVALKPRPVIVHQVGVVEVVIAEVAVNLCYSL